MTNPFPPFSIPQPTEAAGGGMVGQSSVSVASGSPVSQTPVPDSSFAPIRGSFTTLTPATRSASATAADKLYPGSSATGASATRPRPYRPRGAPGAATTGVSAGRIVKPRGRKPIRPREKKALVEIREDMTVDEREAAAAWNRRSANGDAAARSRLRRHLTLLERDAEAAGFAKNSALLAELLARCEGLLPESERARWNAARRDVLAKHGHDVGADLDEVLYRPDEAVQAELADIVDMRREIELRIDSGELALLHGLALATAASRIMGRPLGDYDAYQLQVKKDEFLARMKGAAQTIDEGEKLLTSFEEKANAQRAKLKQVQADLLSFRAAAVEFGLLNEYAHLFPDEKGKAPERPTLEPGLAAVPVPVPIPAAKMEHLFHGFAVDDSSGPSMMYASPEQLQIKSDPSFFGQDYSNPEFPTMLGKTNFNFALQGADNMYLGNNTNVKNDNNSMWQHQWAASLIDDDPFSMANEEANSYPLGPIS